MSDPGPSLERMVRWRELLVEAEQRLGRLDAVTDPRREARWIVEEVLGVDGPEFGAELDSPATIRGVGRLDDLVERRLSGEPIQYVLGHWPFRTLDLYVDRRVLIPRPETEVVTGIALEELDRLRAPGTGTVVDLGTGSGAVGLSIAAERVGARVILTDASDEALTVARANLAGLGVIGTSVQVFAGSWFEALPEDLRGDCDVIVSNPPYVHETDVLPRSVAEWEPESALRSGPDGMDDLRQLVAGAAEWLRPAGTLVLEMDPRQTPDVGRIAARHGYSVETRADLAGRNRALVARLSR